MKATCNECGGVVPLMDDVLTGEIISCPDCGAEFEVKGIKGTEVSIAPAPKVEEDWGE